ncbi:MAG TPA: glycosyltransferase family 2 protein [Stackebrandtia sp.]|uniref:glycosyltransferase family 2 protein n=1 Tax=Stackebrandtia sp. TaxID=2023065 RepID=UPI002D46A0F5|nr:glycosyltransferase family 2 protein [Stackebrandtia sp.]HZE37197.1 glycosyltransferase family 2 protein [Stackebrandtia sp.]
MSQREGGAPTPIEPRPDPDTDGPRFSVVVPAHNEEALLPECLNALLRQEVPGGFEVIVVDNASTDATTAVAHQHGAMVVREERPGVCFARNSGTLAAKGTIVVSTDADTTFADGWLSRIDAAFRADSTLVAVAGPCRFVDAPRWGRWYASLLFGFVNAIYQLTGRIVYVTATNIAFRRDAWTGYDTHATQGGDEVGLLRQLRSRGRVRFIVDNPTFTSPRRMERGLFYNLFVTVFYYYLLGYWLNRLTGRRIIGTAPHIRQRARFTFRQRVAFMSILVALPVTLYLVAH